MTAKSKRPRGSVSFELGSRTAFTLRAVPRAEFELGAPRDRTLDRRLYDLPLRGFCKHLPDDTPCTVTWLIKEGASTREYVDPEPRRLRLMSGGAEFILDVRIDALAMGLFGEGTLACVVQPSFPHCPKGTFDHGPLKYDNTPRVLADTDTPFAMFGENRLSIGERIEVSVELRGCFRGFHARLNVFETDVHEAFSLSSLGLARTFEWRDGDVTPIAWRLGCTEAGDDAPVVFDYQDPGEEGPDLELDHELWIADPADVPLGPFVSRPGEEGSFWRRVPDPAVLAQGKAKAGKPAKDEKHGKVAVKLRFKELAPIGELEPHAVESWKFTAKVPQPGLRKQHARPWPQHRRFVQPQDFGPIEKWVYAFTHHRKTDAIELVDERYFELKREYDPYGGPDPAKVLPHPVKEADRHPDERGKLGRTPSADVEQYFTFEYDSDEVDLYFCLSRIQLPHWRLKDYETDGRTLAPKAPGSPVTDADERAQLHTTRAVARLRDRCLRYAPWDPSFQQRYLDLKDGVDVIEKLEQPDVQVLYLPDALQIVEDAQAQYLADAEVVQNLSGAEDWNESDSLDAQQRFLAAFLGPVVDKYSESEEGRRRLGQFFKETEFRRWVEEYDAKLMAAQKRVELWQQYKQSWVDDAQVAGDDQQFLGKGLYAETREDHLLTRRIGDKEVRGQAVPGTEEGKLHAKNEDAFFAHWASITEHTTASYVGKLWTVRKLHEPGSFVREILLDPAVWYGSGRDRIGEVEHITEVLEQHVLVPAAKFGRYERLADPSSTTREIVTSAGDEVSGGLKTLKQVSEVVSVSEQAISKSLKGLARFDVSRAYLHNHGTSSTLVFYVNVTDGTGPVRVRELSAPLDRAVTAKDARSVLRSLGGDVKHMEVWESSKPPLKAADDAIDTSMTKNVGRVMVLLNGLNFVLQVPKALAALTGDGPWYAKLKAGLALGEAAADFVASVEVLRYVARLGSTARLSVAVRFAGVAAGILGVALATWSAIEAFSEGKYGEGIAQVAIGVGTAAIMLSGMAVGAGLITAGAATWWTGIGIVLIIVGGILAFIFGQPDDTAIEKWLKQSPWGWSPSGNHPARHVRRLLEILIRPKCFVYIAPSSDGRAATVRVDIYSLYFIPGRSQYFVRLLDAKQAGKTTIGFEPNVWFPEFEGKVTNPSEVKIKTTPRPPDGPPLVEPRPWPKTADERDEKTEVPMVSASWSAANLDVNTKTSFKVKLKVRYHPEWLPSPEKEDEYYTYEDSDD